MGFLCRNMTRERPICSIALNANALMGDFSRLLCLSAVLLLLPLGTAGCRAKASESRPLRHEAENGMAAVTYAGRLKDGLSFSANLDLPKIPTNRGWYCVWIMVAELAEARAVPYRPYSPAMLQVGLIRWDEHRRLQPFTATAHHGKGLNFKSIPEYVSGAHGFEIAVDSSTVDLMMDGRSLLSTPRSEFFDEHRPIYLKIAAEVYAVGDFASGSVDEIRLVRGTRREQPPVPWAAFEDRGLRFACEGNGKWRATGQFDPTHRFLQYDPRSCP
jgi:hypothetical protein